MSFFYNCIMESQKIETIVECLLYCSPCKFFSCIDAHLTIKSNC